MSSTQDHNAAMGSAHHSSGHGAALIIGWALILSVCLMLFDGLLLGSMDKSLRENNKAVGMLAASNMSMNVASGLRFGKQLQAFHGMDALAKRVSASFPTNMGVAVAGPSGEIVFADAAYRTNAPAFLYVQGDSAAGMTRVVASIRGRDGTAAGQCMILVPEPSLWNAARVFALRMLPVQGITVASAMLIFALLLRFVPWFRQDSTPGKKPQLLPQDSAPLDAQNAPPDGPWAEQEEKAPVRKSSQGVSGSRRVLVLCFSLFIIIMGVSTSIAVHDYRAQYANATRMNALHVSAMVEQDLNRLLLVGVSLGNTANIDRYLQGISTMMDNSVVISVNRAQGGTVASSHPSGTAVVKEMETVSRLSPALGVVEAPATQERWDVQVDLPQAKYSAGLRAIMLDVLTLVVISLMVMVEGCLLFFQYLENARLGFTTRTLPHDRRSALLRPAMFLFILGMDMSVSFIPLRMGELVGDTASRTMLLGLPVSVEMAMTGLSVFVAGAWMKRDGVVPPMTAGFVLAAAGYLACLVAATPIQFIIARGIAGTGYGLAILVAQAHTVQDGKLADMFAGVYAGSLCGSALGAMLAERLGYSPVFAVSSALIFLLAAFPLLFLSRSSNLDTKNTTPATPPQVTNTPIPFKGRISQLAVLLKNPPFLALVFCSLIPASFISIGLLNFFLPVFLHDAGVPQSDIGRIFLLYCLVIIYAGPLLEKLNNKSRFKHRMVAAAGLSGSVAVLCLSMLPPLSAAVVGAICLGVASSCAIPGQSAYLLRLPIAKRIGTEQTMSLLNAIERVGQAAGPLCIGAGVAVMGVGRAAVSSGAVYSLLTLFFLAIAARYAASNVGKRKSASKEEHGQ